jgi:hypothetical protein
VPIADGPRWEQAQLTLTKAVDDYTSKAVEPAKTALRRLPDLSLIGSPETQTQIYVSLTEHWVACTLRYVVHARSRRTVKHRLQVKALKALASAGIEIAFRGLTILRHPAERTSKE